MKTNETNATSDRAVLSVHTKPETRQRLDALAKAQGRTKSALANEALEQYVSHQEWLVKEIEKGVTTADQGELVGDEAIEKWFRSIGAAN